MTGTTHANALLIGETGLLLRGPPGSGKSALSFMLIEAERRRERFARLIGDDRVQLENLNGRLLARAHPLTLGLIELRGLGLARLPFEPLGVIRGVIDLAPSGAPLPRLPDPEEEASSLCGVRLPKRLFSLADAALLEKVSLFIQLIERK
ncbi:MAG TPA: aldolase [Methylocystis sp.]|nr:aldolase [Methylocystis sp.]